MGNSPAASRGSVNAQALVNGDLLLLALDDLLPPNNATDDDTESLVASLADEATDDDTFIQDLAIEWLFGEL